jgi:hypothetical protein
MEAKRWDTTRPVRMKLIMRQIVRINHRNIRRFRITSFFDAQLQSDLLDERHPVLYGRHCRILADGQLSDRSVYVPLDGQDEGTRSRP